MLKEFIEINNLKARLLAVMKPVSSPLGAASFIDVSASNIAKTVLFIDKDKCGVLCVIPANSSINEQKIQKIVSNGLLLPASQKQCLETTGYELEFVPPVSVYGIKVLLDESLAEKKTIYCSAGEKQKLLVISPHEIIEHNEDIQVVDICI